MENLYDLHSWSKHYREERLAEARKRHLNEQAKVDGETRGLRRVDRPWKTLLTVLRTD